MGYARTFVFKMVGPKYSLKQGMLELSLVFIFGFFF